MLQLCEVQVFEPFDPTAFNTTLDCYPGVYPHMGGCRTCNGPGPTQCTSCQDEHAFVPWRHHATEGACREVKNQIQEQTITSGDEMTLVKWGRQTLPEGALPTVANLRDREVNEVIIKPTCALQKSMRCVKIDANTTKCEVWKKGWLIAIPSVRLDRKSALVDRVKAVGDLRQELLGQVDPVPFMRIVAHIVTFVPSLHNNLRMNFAEFATSV